jgi:hypothetical protein
MTTAELSEIAEAITAAMVATKHAYEFSPGSYTHAALIACQKANSVIAAVVKREADAIEHQKADSL